MTDENLVKMFKDGNEWCFNEIYNRYYNRLYGYAVKYLLSKEDAEEVVNTALFKAFKYLNKFRGEASWAKWLFQILRNQTFSLYRLKRNRGIFVTQRLPYNHLVNQKIAYCIMAAIDDLPDSLFKRINRLIGIRRRRILL